MLCGYLTISLIRRHSIISKTNHQLLLPDILFVTVTTPETANITTMPYGGKKYTDFWGENWRSLNFQTLSACSTQNYERHLHDFIIIITYSRSLVFVNLVTYKFFPVIFIWSWLNFVLIFMYEFTGFFLTFIFLKSRLCLPAFQ